MKKYPVIKKYNVRSENAFFLRIKIKKGTRGKNQKTAKATKKSDQTTPKLTKSYK